MALTIETVRRLIHYFKLKFNFKDDFNAADGDQHRELFRLITQLARTKAKIRYQTFGDKSIFIQDVKILPTQNQIKKAEHYLLAAEIYFRFYQMYSLLHNFKKVAYYQGKYIQLKDSIYK